MARYQKKPDIRKTGRRAKPNVWQRHSVLESHVQVIGKRSRIVKKDQSQKRALWRKRLERLYYLRGTNSKPNHHPSPTWAPAAKEELPKNQSSCPQVKERKRKRLREAEDSLHIPNLQKRPRISPASSAADCSIRRTVGTDAEDNDCKNKIDPIHWWTEKGTWPEEYFEEGSNMNHLLARKKSTSSLHCKNLESASLASSTTPSNQKPREEKCAQYRNPCYETMLETKCSYISESKPGIMDASKNGYQMLLDMEQATPKNLLFYDDLFRATCEKM